jgi:hypothetical protein
MRKRLDLLQGTLDMLILKAVSLGSLRIGHFAAHSASVPRASGDSARFAIPGTVSLGAPGLDHKRMGRI